MRTTIHAKSRKERYKRIRDNIGRGFSIVKLFEEVKDRNIWKDTGHHDGARYTCEGNHSHTTYGAIMERTEEQRKAYERRVKPS